MYMERIRKLRKQQSPKPKAAPKVATPKKKAATAPPPPRVAVRVPRDPSARGDRSAQNDPSA